ncbi:hypothetical protein FRB95_010063 [Tulasnella sp. JGI-2019a]|nr:hypothetical protein FRB95_010063 [Tulasnella sp. JGI-2019a]
MAHNQFQQIIADRVLFYNYNADIWTTVAISQELIPARKDYVELSEDNNFWDVLEGGLFGEAINVNKGHEDLYESTRNVFTW